MQNQTVDLEALYRKELESVTFDISEADFGRLSSLWRMTLVESSLYSMDCDLDIYGQITEVINSHGDKKFNLFTASFLFNRVTQLSPKALGVSVEMYISLNVTQRELTNKWNELAIPIRKKISDMQKNNLVTYQAPLHGSGKSVIPVKGR